MDKGGGSSGTSLKSVPAGFNFPKEYQEGTNVYLGNLGKYLSSEMGSRMNPAFGDPARIAWQQFLQSTFGPTQYGQQLSALNTVDPVGSALRTQTGNAISKDLAAGTGLTPDLAKTIDAGVTRAQAARGNIYGQAPVEAQAFAEGQAGQNLYQQRLSNALAFQNSATPESWMSAIAPVSADRSMAYVNPNAGFLGTNAINQQFQNSLGMSALGQQPQNNSWMSALGSIATIAPLIIGAFSDPRLKSNVKKIGKAKGFNVYKYDIQEPKRTEIGVMADEVAAKRPDAVTTDPVSGYMKVMYPKLGLPMPQQV